MTERYKSYKVGKGLYRVNSPKRKIAINVDTGLSICKHKGRWIVALTSENTFSNGRTFKQNETINRTQALLMIQFLSDYVNLVKPTEATALNASIKASTNRIKSSCAALTGIAIDSEITNKKTLNNT